MVGELEGDQRQLTVRQEAETGAGLWSLPDGQRLPGLVETVPLVLGDPAHPARLLPTDLDNPQGFHSRLTAWLLRQG
jgi:hypothetical protein